MRTRIPISRLLSTLAVGVFFGACREPAAPVRSAVGGPLFSNVLGDGLKGTITFSGDDGNGNSEISIMNADGTGLTQLTHSPFNGGNPNWSPDGQHIAFHSTRDGVGQIFVMNVDGTGLTQLTHNGVNDFAPAWSPNRQQITFDSHRDGDSEIFVMNANGTAVTALTHHGAGVFDGFPRWSPNGTNLAFHSNRDGAFQIFVMNADGTGVTQLTHAGGFGDFVPEWEMRIVPR